MKKNVYSKNEFKIWCKENKKDYKDKMTVLEYLAFEKDCEEALEAYKQIKKGNRKLENVKMVGFFDEDSEFMENAFINLLSAISDYLGYVKKDEMIEKYKKAPSIVKHSILEGASRVINTDLRALVSTVYDCLELAEFDDEDEDDE